jgi:hypothetical protein
MKLLAMTGMLIVGWTTWLRADLTMVQKIESAQKTNDAVELTVRIKDTRARFDFKQDLRSALVDLKEDRIYAIDHAAKKVTIIPLGPVKQLLEKAAQLFASKPGQFELRRTGSTKKINGFLCREYTRPLGAGGLVQISYWMAEGEDIRELAPFRALMLHLSKLAGQEAMGKLQGILVLLESSVPGVAGSRRVLLEVENISRAPIREAEFAVPSDYEILELPAPPKDPPAKPPANPAGRQ